MFQSHKVVIFFLILKFYTISGQRSCCQGENVVTSENPKICKNGSPIDLTCPYMMVYLNMRGSEYEFVNNGDLLIDTDVHSLDSYCFVNNTEYIYSASVKSGFILCYSQEEESSSQFHIDLMSVLAIISSIFYILTIILYVMVKEWKNLQGQCIINAVTGSLIWCLTLAGNNMYKDYVPGALCHMIAYTIYFSSLYGFYWLNLLCFNIWKQVVEPKCFRSIKRWELFYYIYGVGNPIICLTILMVIHHWDSPNLKHIHPGIAETSCWFKSIREALMYYYIPIASLLISNLIYFVWTIIKLWKPTTAYQNIKVLKCRLILFSKLFAIMGLFWICEILSATMIHFKITSDFSWIFTDSINALQGLITFLVLVIFRKKIMHALANKRVCGRELTILKRWKHINVSECEPLEPTIVSDVPMETYILH